MRRWLVGLAQLALLSGCTQMPEIETNTCGNAVVEDHADYHEDCDTFPGQGEKCRPPGSESACHWDCRAKSDGSTPRCPSGWGCDPQGVCREPSGDFRQEGPFEAGDVSWLCAADFDGDQLPDLISADQPNVFQQARFRLHYFDADGELSQSQVFPKQTTHPLVARLNADQRDDLLFSDLNIGVLLGRRDRAWVPSTFNTYQLDGTGPIRIVSVNDFEVGQGAAIAVLTTIEGQHGVFLPTLERGNRLELFTALDGSLYDLAGDPSSANLIEGPDSPCRELVIAFRGATSLRFLDVCEANEPFPVWRKQAVEGSVALPDGVTIDAAPVAADVNGDGHLDLLLGGNGGAYVAYGDGASLEPLAHPFEIERLGAPPELRMPLAVGDFSGDGAPDFVMSDRVIASQRSAKTGEPYYLGVYVNQNAPWTLARIADLNADGYPDVVAASDSGPDITYLNGTGELVPVPSMIEARGSVPFLAIDDLDGDSIDDLAFVERDPARPNQDALKIGFGQVGGAPLAATQVAQLEGVEQLSAFHQEGIGNLMLASSELVDGRRRGLLALLSGSPDRLPFAPFTLVDFARAGNLREFAALELALGAFGAPAAHDVMALATPYDGIDAKLSFWLVPGIERGKSPPRQLNGVLPEGFEGASSAMHVAIASASADLDGDQLDEAVWMMPAEGGKRCGLFIAGVDAAGEALRDPASLLLDARCPEPALSAQDLNSDEHADLLLGVGDQESGGLLVLWNDGSGKFDAADSVLVSPDGTAVHAWSVLGGEAPRLALVTDAALWLVDRGASARSFEAPLALGELNHGKAVAVADLNRDGLQDLAVGDADGLWLWKARFK